MRLLTRPPQQARTRKNTRMLTNNPVADSGSKDRQIPSRRLGHNGGVSGDVCVCVCARANEKNVVISNVTLSMRIRFRVRETRLQPPGLCS